MKIGFIVNPVAGIGGSAGLKGSDGEDIQSLAEKLGAKAKANDRAKEFFYELKRVNIVPKIISAPGVMGSDTLDSLQLDHEVIGDIKSHTTGDDTTNIAKEMVKEGIDIIIFAGGDGTARNIYDAVKDEVPVIGIPAGTKMHSAVFGHTPQSSAKVLIDILNGKIPDMLLEEVMDIDEEEFRNERLNVKLYGMMKVPFIKEYMQSSKSTASAGGQANIFSICYSLVDNMEEDTLYFIGTGSTLKPISEILGYKGSLLGVDAVYNKKVIGLDLTEKEVLNLISKYDRIKIVITVIGGQGYLFGRGNQQFSSEVIKKVGKDNIIVLATKQKLNSVNGPLIVDTGDEEVNNEIRGYVRVLTDYDFYTLKKVK